MATETGNSYVNRDSPVWSGVDGGKGPMQIDIPLGLSIDRENGNIFVCDYGVNRIQVFSKDGNYLRTIEPEGMSCPTFVSILPQHLFVSGEKSKEPSRIYKLDKVSGGILCRVETDYSTSCMSVDTDTLYVGMCNSKGISQFSVEDLKSVGKIQLNSPLITEDTILYDIKLAPSLFIVLFLKCTYPIQSFSRDGSLINSIVSQEQLTCPYFFCLDGDMNIIISDAGANNVKVFNREGQLVATIGQKGTGPGEFIDPLGIDINREGHIVVVDQKVSNKLQAF